MIIQRSIQDYHSLFDKLTVLGLWHAYNQYLEVYGLDYIIEHQDDDIFLEIEKFAHPDRYPLTMNPGYEWFVFCDDKGVFCRDIESCYKTAKYMAIRYGRAATALQIKKCKDGTYRTFKDAVFYRSEKIMDCGGEAFLHISYFIYYCNIPYDKNFQILARKIGGKE